MFNKVAIYHATAGAGHKSAALSLEAAFLDANAAKKVEVIDCLDYTTRLNRRINRKTYLEWAAKHPHLLGYLYDLLNTPWDKEGRRLFFDVLVSRKFIDLLRKSDADLAVCTHFAPSHLISAMRQLGKIQTPQAVVVTDFDVHAMWLCRQYEHFFVAREEARVYCEALEIRPEALKATGIPIKPIFAVNKDKEAMRAKHGLRPGVPTVLISAGGYGVGKIEEMLKALLKVSMPLQVVAICGAGEKAEKLKVKVDAIASGVAADSPVTIVPVGYTKEMDEFMSAADMIVGKPGGLTTSEALAKGLVFIIVNPIPGQEDRNSDHLLQGGAGIRCTHLEILHWHIEELLRDPLRLALMQTNSRNLGRPHAAMDIVRAVSNARL